MIRKAIKDDLNSIVDLWEEMMKFHTHKSDLYKIKANAREIYTDYLKEVFKSDGYTVLVYEIENEILRYLMAEESVLPQVYDETIIGTVIELSVSEKHRNRGIGEALLKEVEKIFIDKGIKRLECMVSNFNEISKNFWKKNGYSPYNLMCVKKLG